MRSNLNVPHPCLLVILILIAILKSSSASAQANYEIQVYGSDTVAPHTTMFELHSNFTADGQKTTDDGTLPTNHAQHETLEITHGFTKYFEIGYYNFMSINAGAGFEWAGTHIRPRVAVPAEWHWPVGVSLSTEFGYVRPEYSADTWGWEIRPIIDKQMGKFYWSVNPALEKSFKGPSKDDGFVFAPNVQVSYDFSSKVNGALEYYGSVGTLTGWDPLNEQEHQIFPAVNLNFSPDWEINVGVGFGLTNVTDRLIFKAIVGRRMKF